MIKLRESLRNEHCRRFIIFTQSWAMYKVYKYRCQFKGMHPYIKEICLDLHFLSKLQNSLLLNFKKVLLKKKKKKCLIKLFQDFAKQLLHILDYNYLICWQPNSESELELTINILEIELIYKVYINKLTLVIIIRLFGRYCGGWVGGGKASLQ